MKTLKYIVAALLLISVSSCRTLEEYNVDPNRIDVFNEKISPADMMDELICNGAMNCQQRFYDTYAELMQYTCITSSSNEVISRYYVAPSYIENCWDNFSKWAANADHMLKLCDNAIERDGASDDIKNYKAIALTLRALYMDMLVSTFGQVPFKEAFSLREDITKPKFDTEKEIYIQLIQDLETANTLYNSGKTLSNITKDKLYNGETKKWQKFTNSLYLRLLMRLSLRSSEMEKVWGESVAQKIHKVLKNPSTYPVMEDYTDNAAVYFSGESPFQNAWGGYTQSTLAGHRLTEHMYNMTKPQTNGGDGRSDPRIYLWFQPWSASYGWIGIQSGIPGDDMQSTGYSVMNFQTMNDYKLPYSFMNCDEVYFIKAEAYARNDDDHWAAIAASENEIRDLYETGIRQSCEFWRYIYCEVLGYRGILATLSSNPVYRNFFAAHDDYDDDSAYTHQFYKNSGGKLVADGTKDYPPVISNPAIQRYCTEIAPFNIKNALECIINQKFLANFRVGLEGWCDYRRTGYPVMTILDGTYNNHILPYRLAYPNRTKTTNDANYQELLRRLANTYYDGADNMLTPIWWSEAALQKEIR